MKPILFLCFLFCGYTLYPQTKVYDYFDFEGSYDDYKEAYSKLKEESINGNVKELKKTSSRVNLHLRLNKKGQITEQREYVDSASLSRIGSYKNGRIINWKEYRQENSPAYIFYKYSKAGKLIEKSFSKNQRNTNPTTRITCFYNNKNQLISRNHGLHWTDKFVYEGDSVIWKLVFSQDSLLKGVGRLLSKKGKSELITWYKVDTLSSDHFKHRINPSSEFLRQWDNDGNLIQTAEFKYDSVGVKTVIGITKFEYFDKLLIRSNSVHNTNHLKGTFSREYVYNDNGLLEAEISRTGTYPETRTEYRYDDKGNIILSGGFIYRFFYDKNGNWILKQRFHKKNSSTTEIRRGVMKSYRYSEDTWVTDEKREISYYK